MSGGVPQERDGSSSSPGGDGSSVRSARDVASQVRGVLAEVSSSVRGPFDELRDFGAARAPRRVYDPELKYHFILALVEHAGDVFHLTPAFYSVEPYRFAVFERELKIAWGRSK